MKKYFLPLGVLGIFMTIAVTLWLTQNNIFYLFNFSYIGISIFFGIFLYIKKYKYARRVAQLLVGLYMLVYSKLISAIPKPDIAISMGCNVSCPFIGRPFDENWGLDDPTGKSDDEFKAVMEQIRQNVLTLKSKLCDGSSF